MDSQKKKWDGQVSICGAVYVTVTRAAQMLDWSEDMVRRSCDDGEMAFIRHPDHNYRLIRKENVIRRMKRKAS